MSQLVKGWNLPDNDTYFHKFISEGAGGGFQIDHLNAAMSHVKNVRMAVDAGAHVGFWTVTMSGFFDNVHAFEMVPDTYEALRLNTSKLSNVQIHNVALGSEFGRCDPAIDHKRLGNTGSCYVKKGVSVQVIPLDSVPLAWCDLLKVDVEGFEFQVLQGARETITTHKPVIIMETDKKFAKQRYSIDDDAAEKFLIGIGYEVVEHIRPDKIFVHKG